MRRFVSLQLSLALVAGGASAQKPVEPCCNITGIDRGTGIVTARETSTGHVFRFAVKGDALLAKLRVGGKVWADFAAGKVSVEPLEPCCGIIGAAPKSPRADPATPCCFITAVDARTGIVTARVNANGRLFTFEVKDRALLRSLAVGGKVWASAGSRQVRVDPIKVCCNIVGAIPTALP